MGGHAHRSGRNHEQEVMVEMRRQDKEALEFDVTHCRFARVLPRARRAELGALLICETDFDIAAAGGSEVSFTRDQTIMQGASCCTSATSSHRDNESS